MIRQIGPGRTAIFALALGVTSGLIALPAAAQDTHRSRGQSQSKPASGRAEAAAAKSRGKSAPAEPAKPDPLQTYGDWATYAAGNGKSKTCYALGTPKERKPELKREQAYLFVSTRPGEGVHNEVSIVMGFDVKPNAAPNAQIGRASYDLVAKGANLWLKNAAAEAQFVEAMRKGSSLVVKAPSTRGNVTTDTYSLKGLGPALDRVRKECP